VKLAIVVALLVGCSAPKDGVVLWHAYNDRERAALEHVAAEWNEAHPDTPLTLVQVPYDAFADKITSAVPNGNGPDLFVYSQDRIADWAAAGGARIPCRIGPGRGTRSRAAGWPRSRVAENR